MTQDKIVDKLRKLKAMADSAGKVGNEEEAQAFANMVQTLLAKHKLDASEIEWEQQKQEELVYLPTDLQKTHQTWEMDLASIVAKASCCRVVFNAGGRKTAKRVGAAWFYGTRTDAEGAVAAYTYLMAAATHLSERAYVRYFYECKGRGEVHRARGYKGSWLLGFVGRMARRYRDNEIAIQSANAGTALVRISQALARVDEAAKNMKQTEIKRDDPKNYRGYQHGVEAANRITLSNDLKASERQVTNG
jgi:hypothetical protein